MKYLQIFVLLLFFFSIGCKEKKNTSTAELSINDRYRDSSINFIRKKFGLPHSEDYKTDSNSFVFYGTRTFDTSFLIEVKQTAGEIKGIYYEVLPNYHSNVNDFSIEENQLLFFEGYSFTLDTTKWEKIKTLAQKTLLMDTGFEANNGCRDCPEYILCFNSKSGKSNVKSLAKFEALLDFLKDLFLENFIKRRKPIKFNVK
jgi:hypothetical protein